MRPLPKFWPLILFLSLLAGWRTAWLSTLLAAPQLDTDKCTVEGIVTSIPTGAPLKGARIVLYSTEKRERLYHAETDATGQFSISAVEPGKYAILVEKKAYEKPERDCNSNAVQIGDDVTLVSGQKLSALKFQLLAPAVIAGAVYDSGGDPVAGAYVEALGIQSSEGEERIAPLARAETDDRGQFRIFNLKHGQYFLRISDPFYFMQQLEDDEDEAETKTEKQLKGFLPIYFPDTTELSQATFFDVKPGDVLAGIDFTIHAAQVLRIGGRVVNGLTGEPIDDVPVGASLLSPGPSEGSGTPVTSGDSNFRIDDLAPGRYLLIGGAQVMPDRQYWAGWQEIELTNSSVDDVLLKIFPGHDLPGRVQLVGQTKINFQALQVVLERHVDTHRVPIFTNVKADGTFLLLNVMQDTYDIQINGLPEDYYMKSAHWGSVEALDDGLRIGGEPPTAPLILEVSPAAAQAEGVVQAPNGKPACNATVVLIPDTPRRSIHRYYQSTDVDRSGHYTLKGIPPGSYKLFGFDHADEVGYLDPASLQPYENSGQPVHFDEGDRRTVQLKLIPTTKNNP
jgi:Carboxypeptidase regulatory-like domain